MLDKSLLKSIIALNGDTQGDLANALGISETSLSSKLNGKQPFKSSEIYMIKKLYKLAPEQVDNIFFRNHN